MGSILSAPNADFDSFSAPFPPGWGVIPVVIISRHPHASAVRKMEPTLKALRTLSRTRMRGNIRRFFDSTGDKNNEVKFIRNDNFMGYQTAAKNCCFVHTFHKKNSFNKECLTCISVTNPFCFMTPMPLCQKINLPRTSISGNIYIFS